MEEFGCTTDSLQYYPLQPNSIPLQGNSNVFYPVNWMLDLITNPQGDQVHITYQRDMTTAPDGMSYPRDVVPATIEWDSPGCVNARQLCTGTAWQPHYRVQFGASHHAVTRLTNAPSGCNTDATVRCDDPASVTGGVTAPLVNGTFVLNDANVQTNNTSGGSYSTSAWNTVRDYQFSYEQSGPAQIQDPLTGKQLSTAGYLDLSQFQEVGDNGTTAYPPMTFGYSSQTEYYEDGNYTPQTAASCGPSWNTGGTGPSCDLWSQTYGGNSRYLTTIDNGQGQHQTISWVNARNNTHGAGTGLGADDVNPAYCNTHQSGYPCNSADDQAWSRIVATGRTNTVNQLTQAGQGGTKTTTPVTSSWAYNYQLTSLTARECLDCVAGMYWGNQNDNDYLDYYNGHFMGFAQTAVSNPDGSIVTHHYLTTEGWGVYSLDTNLVPYCPTTHPPVDATCHLAPWWDLANAGHGLETETDYTDTDGTTPLKKITATYNPVCPPSGVSATPQYTVGGVTFGPWGSNQISELDHDNPVAVCDVRPAQQVTTTYDGSANSLTTTENYTYDSSGQVTQTQRISSSGGGSPTTIYDKTTYVSNNGLTLPPAQRTTADQSPYSSNSFWNGSYLIDLPALQTVEDSSGSGARASCHYTLYDGMTAYTTGQTSTLTQGKVAEQDSYTNCGTAPNYTYSGKIGATTSYDSFGNATGSKDPDAVNGDTSHTGAAGTACASSTTCTQYDGTTQAKATGSSSVGNLTSASGYDTSAAGGFGLWPTSTTDANGQTTTYSYDALGRTLTMVAPGQSSGPATETTVYKNWCGTTSPSSPCVEVDTARRTSSSSSVLTRQFYDGEGRLVETRTAAPGGQDVIQYTLYNAAGQAAQSSVKYFVTAYTGPAGVDAYSIPDSSQNGTLTSYDGLGRMLSATDALSNVGSVAYSVVCNAPGTNDAACYEQTLATDPNSHQQGSLSDAFGRTIYAQRYSGNSPATYAVYSTAKNTYDYLGHVTQTQQPDGHSTTTTSYDAAGRVTSVSDPDRGLASFSFDSNGNLTQQIDARCGTSLPQTACSAGTTVTGYDGLNRPLWRNNSNTPSGAYVTYSYDGSPFSNGTGRLTAEVFRGSAGTSATTFSGAYTYTYDTLGRTIRTNQTMGGAGACPQGWTCEDIGSPGQAGSQSFAGDGIWTISGGGADIWGTSDQFHSVYQSVTGTMTITAQVAAQTNSNATATAKSGLMARASNAANAPFYAVMVEPNNTVYVTHRDTAGASAAVQASTTGVTPRSIAITRIGTTFYAFTSSDGVTWTYVPGSAHTITAIGSAALVGMAVSAVNNATVSTATFDAVKIETQGTGACPAGWTCQDVGAPSPAGTQTYLDNGTWVTYGSGTDISGTSDQFHFISQAQPGDGSLSTHVEYQVNTNSLAKAGVMMRASSAANAPYYDVVATPSGTVYVQYRDSAGAAASTLTSFSDAVPAFLKIQRVGTTFTAYTSSDGVTWIQVGGSSRVMSNLSGSILMGLAITSHSAGVLSSAIMDQLSATLPPPNTVVITPLADPAGVNSYPIQTAYNDASQPTSLTYSDNEVANYSYDSGSGWLSSLSTTPAGGSATTLLGSIGYSGAGGAAGHATSASVAGGTYTFGASYDADVRLSSLSVSNTNTSALLFQSQRGYDAASNVTAVNTTLAAGTDNQAFCYDELNRLTWAGASGTPNCGTSLTPGSLSAASYTQLFTYDTLDRLQSGPLGSYTYGDAAHLHAATSIDNGATNAYSARYDAVGDMTCRAADGTTTCSGTPTGAVLGYDNEGRLSSWQNVPNGPTTTDSFLYDGAGNRLEQSVTLNGSITTTTIYVAGGLEEITAVAVGTTLTKYFTGAGGLPTAERTGTNGRLSYLANDGLGSLSETLNDAGSVTFAQLYTPYGTIRYSTGSSPTSFGYTGQRADSTSGLDYYGARYYDPVAGQFVSADTKSDGFNRYGYVHGNPTTHTDPTGHWEVDNAADHDGPGEAPPTERGGGDGPGDSGGSGIVPGGRGDGTGLPEDYINDIYRAWSRYLGMAPGSLIATEVTLGRGDSVEVVLEQNTLMVTYHYGDGTTATYNATYASNWLREQWLQVLSEHYAGDPYNSTVRRPGRLAYAPITSEDRAKNFTYLFADEGTSPSPARGVGWTTNVPAGGLGDVQIRCMDYSNSKYGRGQGPYLRFQVGTDPLGGPNLNFNGVIDDNDWHNHFYLGTGGEGDDLPLQNALAGTILSQYEFGR
jgi:RHS repeat-associated protein